MTKFIALSGKKQSGKDESAKILTRLIAERGLKSQVTWFAKPLKEFCITVLGLPREKVYGTDADKNEISHIKWDTMPLELKAKYSNKTTVLENYPSVGEITEAIMPREGFMTVREVLQIVGTDIVREMFWQDAWSSYPFRQEYKESIIILPDCRFENEVHETLKAGGIVLRLERNTGLIDNHASELALDGYEFDFRYVNNGTLVELEQFLKGFLNCIL